MGSKVTVTVFSFLVHPNKLRSSFLHHRTFPLFTTHGPSRRVAFPVLALDGATSYWASVVANPPGHMSDSGASSTGVYLVAPAGSARLVSLGQGPTRRRRGYGGIAQIIVAYCCSLPAPTPLPYRNGGRIRRSGRAGSHAQDLLLGAKPD